MTATDPIEATPNLRPCAVCGDLFPPVGPGSSWPWTQQRRICQPCLKAVDQ